MLHFIRAGRVVRNVFETDGDLAVVQSKKNQTSGYFNYADSFTYTAAGAISSMQLGNGKWESTTFNSRLQPTQIALGTTQNGTDKLKLEYNYGTTNNNGNVQSQTITVPTFGISQGFTATQTYTYDSLNRLKSATEMIGGSQSWKQTFLYDRYGNRNFDAANTTTLGSCPASQCNPTINVADNRFNSGQGYTYDSSGNVISDAQGRSFTFDAENKQTQVSNTSGTIGIYSYDGEGKRVKKTSATEETIFVYDASGKLVAEYSNQIAQTPQVSYLTSDNLGSPRINTDQNGAVIARHDYHPFGEEIYTAQRNNGVGYADDSIRKQFTSYERDKEINLDFAQARYYSPKLGRFYSIDPENADADYQTPQSWNGYSYARNNPQYYTDPDGEEVRVCDNQGQCAVISDDEANRGLFSKSWQKENGHSLRNGIIYQNGEEIGTYELISFDGVSDEVNAIFFGPNSIGEQTKKKGLLVGAAAAGGIAAGVCIGVPAACPAAYRVGKEVIKNLFKRGLTPDDLKQTSKPGRKTKGKTTQYERSGGMSQATQEFNALNPSNVQQIPTEYGPGMTGTLPNGSTVTVRPGSSGPNGKPTLEIRKPNGRKEKYRYAP